MSFSQKKNLSPSQIAWKRFKKHKLAMVSLWALFILAILSIVIPILSDNRVGDSDVKEIFRFPSSQHFLGTDENGYDVFVRLFYGGRISLTVGILAAISSALIGTIIGALSGYYAGQALGKSGTILLSSLGALIGLITAYFVSNDLVDYELPIILMGAEELKTSSIAVAIYKLPVILIGTAMGGLLGFLVRWLDDFLMRITDTMLSLPVLPLLMILSHLEYKKMGLAFINMEEWGNIFRIIIIISLFSWMSVSRLVRGEVLSLKNREFIDACHVLGASQSQIIFKHLIPNALTPVIISTTLSLGSVIQYEAVLSFLGLGIKAPMPTWGNMLFYAQEYFIKAPALIIYPGMLIAVTVICINFIGDGLRDALDPRQIMTKE